MKKTLLLISTILIGASSYAQYEGFENWTQSSLLTLDDYNTSINEGNSESTYRVTDPITGTYALKLETVLTPSMDTTFGYFLSGDPQGGIPGQAVTLPLPGAVDSIIGWYKYDIMPNDSAVFVIETFGLGTTTGGGVFYIKGQQTTWKRFAYPVSALGSDSITIAAASSDALNDYNGVPGTWIQFDDIQLKSTAATANILNYSFENWTTLTWDNPNGWRTANEYAFNEPLLPAIKSTDVYSGNFALELNTILNDRGDTIGGIATNGDFDENGFLGGVPYTAIPAGVEFYYKNTTSGIDTSWVNIQFKNNGAVIMQAGTQLTPAANYTLFNQNFTLPMAPDTVLLGTFAGNNPGSQLYIDNIDMVFPLGIAEGLTVERLVTYPNPATDVLKIRFNITNTNSITIKLIDAVGKEISTRSLGHLSSGTYRESFNTSSFSTGIYFIEFTLGDEKIIERFVVQ